VWLQADSTSVCVFLSNSVTEMFGFCFCLVLTSKVRIVKTVCCKLFALLIHRQVVYSSASCLFIGKHSVCARGCGFPCLPVRVCMCAVFIALAQRDAGIPSGALMSTCQLCAGAIIIIGSVHVECAAHRMAVYQSAPSNSCAISRYHRVTIVQTLMKMSVHT